MAANFWTSSHYMNWLRNAGTMLSDAGRIRARDTDYFTEEELVRMQMSFIKLISALARKTNLRQRVAATAIVYFKRFYLRCGFIDHDPRLIAPVALYLAAKVEEHTVPAKAIIAQLTILNKGEQPYPYGVADLYDYEFRLIAELDFDLIVFHPYRPLMQYCADPQLTTNLQVAWAIVNDSYRIYMAGTLNEKDMSPWVKMLKIDTCDLADVVKTISMVYAPSKTSSRNSGKESIGEALSAKLQSRFVSGQSNTSQQPQQPQQQQQVPSSDQTATQQQQRKNR